MKDIKNLLIYFPNWLGDIVMSIPALTLIREYYKDIKITALIKTSMVGFLKSTNLVDDIIEINNYKFFKKYNFDTVILLPNSFESALKVSFNGIKRRIGYRADYRSFLLTDVIEREEVRWWHTSDYYINLLKAIDIYSQRPSIKLEIKKEFLEEARKYLNSINPENKKIFAFGIGATNSYGKIYKEEYFAEVMNHLSKKYDALILFITTKSEIEISKKIESHLENKAFIPYFSLDIITAILSLCDGFIGNDSGAMHIASIVGIPTLALYFATPYYQNSPIGLNSHYIFKKVENDACICGGRKCELKTFECREVIKPEEVICKFEEIIDI